MLQRKKETKEQSTTVVKTTLNGITKYPITKLIIEDVNASQNILEILIYLIQTCKRHSAFEQSRKLEEPTQYNFRKHILKEVSIL